MNILLSRPPDAVCIGGVEYKINPSHRIMMRLELFRDENELSEIVSDFYCGSVPEDVEEAVRQMLSFHAAGEQQEAGQTGGGSSKRIYDFDQDADAIFASFFDAYGMNLTRADLHWWEFVHLMFNVPASTPLGMRLYYRSADMSKVPKTERKRFLEMRANFALKNEDAPKTLEDRNAEMRARVLRLKEEQGCRG